MSETCDVAHGTAPADPGVRTLVAVFASPVSRFLLRFARDLGYHVALYEPDAARVTDVPDGIEADTTPPPLDGSADVVVTDHHRPELGVVLKIALEGKPRWVGVLGNPRHEGPHVAALRGLGVPDEEIARVHRPVGLNIGSRTPAEIALATLAGLLADRNGRPGGFDFGA
ncbi:xanthine dehydrogenase [Amycolatopsis balhimycina DSM 5908]|uniref:Xanthine dehydrogenase n=1 Tax=Amycolatopsis balhimycina DSM 5908 TaxID=1081091 RepID=A0A428W7A9_AMYBA|nr:XdhC family protein [Amycolatopsis balhimycina]RSM39012.1 xanthine dehydrogenase [Amycolatopsis balhimycina DSM 5908]